MSKANAANPAGAANLYGTDLRLDFPRGGGTQSPDLVIAEQDLATVSGLDNLLQALTLRLMVDQGELASLGHKRYGSRIRDLIGEPLDRANLELLRRYVRKELLQDARVAEVTQVTVALRSDDHSAVDVAVTVLAALGETLSFEVTFDA